LKGGKKVLFFGDVGIDDTVALIYAHLTAKIDIVGIVADYGNVPRIEMFDIYFKGWEEQR
jgi:purine nucleosidase